MQQEVGPQIAALLCQRCEKIAPIERMVAVGPGPESNVPPIPVCRDTCVEPDDRCWEIAVKMPPRPEWN